MLRLVIPAQDIFDEKKQEFLETKETTLELEHSLISISKWESKWHKPFLEEKELKNEKLDDYIRCMIINQNYDPIVVNVMPSDIKKRIVEYIQDPMTATWFSDEASGNKPGGHHQVYTSELIYYLMINYGIPFDREKWHLNRLLTLIRVCQEKAQSQNPKKTSKGDLARRYSELNAARLKAHGGRG